MAVADVDTHMVSRVFAHIEAGDLSRALHIAEEGYERAVTTSRPLTQFWFSLLLGRIHLCTGAVATAQRRFASARALGIDSGLSGPVRSALVGSAIAHALLGDATAAEAAQVEIDRMTPFGFMAPERALADGWVAVAKGDLASARRLLADGAKIAADSGHMTSAIWMLHDIARLGGADDVAGQVSALAAATDSTLAHARAVHVTAMVTGRQLEMVAAADQFEAIGAHLLAAEACVAAAEIARTEGDQRSAVALTVRAERNGAKCEGATSPGLLTVAGAVEPLTEREREIAFMAANGMTSREIADRIFVSLRTVSNHLQHVYDKLGVRSRADLRQALDFGQIVTTSNG